MLIEKFIQTRLKSLIEMKPKIFPKPRVYDNNEKYLSFPHSLIITKSKTEKVTCTLVISFPMFFYLLRID